ncbi:TATA box-binding protein-associated factor RNA polymerase I subunit A [Anguilla anguilla]|uniref:TATA box-binding protein-associated factor RNA polymerase I subunit A n=1 Tax=Anguilla anguilla TaxID=7936 RepID=UPI0015AC7146|nr:TATA box-binding protein-associated factor RNA polymerase I subunit A [Anguilla anguilla]XP_035279387.1 TATA box-binding protein-associated factor RNA polymerase I subunit A [Anguilla anguilla]XP_035279388.1 TATA box-binding protein-associated factor RNA polymerase I subunit A [Anguilla anguilla]
MDDIDAELGLLETHLDDVWNDDLEGEERAAPARLPVKVHWDTGTHLESGFHRTARLCLRRIHGLMLQQRWQEAAEYMSSYAQTLEDSSMPCQMQAAEIIWKLGTAILQQHPNSRPEDFSSFYERMKHTGVKHYLKISLEHSFHLLVNGKFDDAKRQLSVAESWRYGKISASQSQTIKLIQAYRAFLDYFTWSTKKSIVSAGDESDVSANQEMHVYFRQASVTLKEVLKEPGVWDPFIISYVDMLEFYDDQEGALHVLEEYAYNSRFPPNPNAHVYLYQYLKKHKASKKRLIKVLQVLQSLVPCHELMLELCSLLVQRGEEEHLREAVSVIFSLLDYSGWKDSLEAWSCLRNILRLLKKKHRHLAAGEWESRPWWTAYHFSTFQAKRNLEMNPRLAKAKAAVASAMSANGNGCSYCRKRRHEMMKAQRPGPMASRKSTRRRRR